MEKIINPLREQWPEILMRPQLRSDDLLRVCQDIFNEVMADGDQALRKYTARFDKVELGGVQVTAEEFELAEGLVEEELKEAIRIARKNIESFHIIQKQERVEFTSPDGFRCWQEPRGIEKVGLYIPGGSAPLFSTVLMLAVPAQIAGCREIVLCTPPDRSGNVNPAILWTAKLCGVTGVYKVGGVQAIGAMTFGTESVPRVFKIFGPGNQYVTAAKQLACNYGVSIDMPAGPSEVMVIADESACPEFIAADLLSQAEHGADSQVIFVTPAGELIPAVEKALEKQLEQLPRKEVARQALVHSKYIVLQDMDACIAMSNEYAPEHLILSVKDYADRISQITNAGSVFLGNYSPESAGDYASGTNHTLPTNGYAKSFSGVNLDAFVKKVTFQEISRSGLEKLGPVIEVMAEREGLTAHKNAVSVRLSK